MIPSFYHDRERKLIVYDEPKPHRVMQYLPETKPLHNGYIAVPESLHAIQTLRWLGYAVPPPMRNYSYPRGPAIKVPFRAQIITANFLAANPKAFCLNEMRTGKTLAALWASDFIMEHYPQGDCRCLVVAPLSILQRVWGDAIFNNLLGKRDYVILHGDAKKREKLLAEPHDYYIINSDGLKVGATAGKRGRLELTGLSKALAERDDIRIGIVDEFSAYKHHRTGRSLVARAILASLDYLWMLSGTPTPNGPLDAYGPAFILNKANGESFRSYEARTMYPVTQFKSVPRQGSHEAALAMLQPAVRFKMIDCVDVPPVLPPQLIDVEMTPQQTKWYKEMKREAVLMVENGTISAVNEASLRTKLIQIACGAVYENRPEGRVVHTLDARPRLAAVEELVEWDGGKVIVLAPLTGVLHLLYDHFSSIKEAGVPRYKCGIIEGDVKTKERDKVIRDFVEGDMDILFANPATMSHGLDLSVSKLLVWFTLPDKTEQYLQANERIRGPKQTQPTLVAQLAATPTEREIYRRLESNESLQGVMLALVKEHG
jgi:SNF2 family DNA or RNA helicase